MAQDISAQAGLAQAGGAQAGQGAGVTTGGGGGGGSTVLLLVAGDMTGGFDSPDFSGGFEA